MPNEPTANVLDVGAITIWIASLSQILPSIAALLSIVWFIIRIMESETVQQLLGDLGWIKPKETKNGNNKTDAD